jgi:RNA polymerase sigma factor (sigma-70 family)
MFLMSNTGLSDAMLVARCRAGEQDAWDEFVLRFSRYSWAIARRVYRLSEADSDEVVQEVFARCYQHLGSLRSDDAVRPWIGQLTRRLCVDRLRGSKREDVVDELPDDGENDKQLERLALAMDVRSALAKLPETCQEMLDRFFTRDQSYDAIAESLDMPSGTIGSRISRCLARLRDALGATTPLEAQ